MGRAMKCEFFATGGLEPAGGATPVHTGSLLSEMTDLARLADLPHPFYKTIQFSSYDRSSSLPGGPANLPCPASAVRLRKVFHV